EAPIRLGELARQRGDALAALNHHLQALRTEERTETFLTVADDYRRLGRADDAIQMYQRVLARDRDHLTALRGLRDVAAERGSWVEALEAQEGLIRIVSREDRAGEEAWLAGIQYELGRALLDTGDTQGAASRFRDALRARPDFLPAALALGDVHLKAGEAREALRVWERALETQPAPPLLSRIEQLHRADGRPARMISLYQDAATRHPENLALSLGLGRVYFELAMLDEAAEQFQKLEVRAPELPAVHAYLGAIFERHGQIREAFEEYRRALRFPEGFQWPHRCTACGATQPSWFDRCLSCRRWNASPRRTAACAVCLSPACRPAKPTPPAGVTTSAAVAGGGFLRSPTPGPPSATGRSRARPCTPSSSTGAARWPPRWGTFSPRWIRPGFQSALPACWRRSRSIRVESVSGGSTRRCCWPAGSAARGRFR